MRLVRRVESGAEPVILTAESAVCGGAAYRCGRLGSPPLEAKKILSPGVHTLAFEPSPG